VTLEKNGKDVGYVVRPQLLIGSLCGLEGVAKSFMKKAPSPGSARRKASGVTKANTKAGQLPGLSSVVTSNSNIGVVVLDNFMQKRSPS